MRRRVLQATIAAVAVAVILLGVPLGLLGAQMVRQNDLRSLDTRAGRVANQVDFRLQFDQPVTDQIFEGYVGSNGEVTATIVVRTPDDRVFRAGPDLSGRLVPVQKTSAGTLRNFGPVTCTSPIGMARQMPSTDVTASSQMVRQMPWMASGR